MAVSSLLRAALPSVPVVNQLPGVRKQTSPFTGLTRELVGVVVRREHVEAYAAVCSFPRKDTVPLPYPHVLAFPLHLSTMSEPDFPWPALGMVHLENSLTGHRPVHVGEKLDVRLHVGTPRPHAKGILIDFETEVTTGGELVWESTSTYLRRQASPEKQGSPDAGLDLPDAPEGGLSWQLPADLGRRYAAVSGDHNPIHLYPLTAKALGFPRQIAHGMWSKARCIAALENRLPDAVRVQVAFKKPILLPGSVAFGHRENGDEHAFSLISPRNGAPHLLGRATPA